MRSVMPATLQVSETFLVFSWSKLFVVVIFPVSLSYFLLLYLFTVKFHHSYITYVVFSYYTRSTIRNSRVGTYSLSNRLWWCLIQLYMNLVLINVVRIVILESEVLCPEQVQNQPQQWKLPYTVPSKYSNHDRGLYLLVRGILIFTYVQSWASLLRLPILMVVFVCGHFEMD